MGGVKVPKNSAQKWFDPGHYFIAKSIFGEKTAQKKRPRAGKAPDPMMQYLSQMQADQAAQAEASRLAQKEALTEAQQQSALSSARQGEMAAQQTLSQTGAMQQAKDIAAQQAQQQAYSSAGAAAVGEGFDITKARQEQAANIAGTGAIPSSKLPFYGMETPSSTAMPSSKPVNVFALPKYENIKFGGV